MLRCAWLGPCLHNRAATSPPPSRLQIFNRHRVRDSSAPTTWIHRSIRRGQQAGLGHRARPPATVRRLSGSPGRARPERSTPVSMGGAPRAAASTTSRGASAGGPEVQASTRSYLRPTYGTFRQGPRLQVTAAAPSPRFQLLRVCRTLQDKAPPRYPPVLGEVPAPL
ncbi:hypothetical protein NDU88_004012 [Pleurodeles waltl]|uniref:Uncharacterized protein n=1 Tax=Pleurodeles waltl TaxID=8319 RepID=A0AAV7SHL3_PLEWA|nr:hypothetical protein NDU88_004012 [Pleurodeles waltl]